MHSLGGLGWNFDGFRWHNREPKKQRNNRWKRSASSSGASTSSSGSYFDRVKGWQGPWKAALTSGTLSAMGDLLAQGLSHQTAKEDGKVPTKYDPYRTLRMFGFGACWYGPCQYYWYNLLEWLMPIKNTPNFLCKVTANQLLLGPVTLTAVFAWNLALTGQASGITQKVRDDLWPTMINGWKFWVPAASINFYFVPIQQQVLYMSCCGVLWTAYLSYASANKIKTATA